MLKANGRERKIVPSFQFYSGVLSRDHLRPSSSERASPFNCRWIQIIKCAPFLMSGGYKCSRLTWNKISAIVILRCLTFPRRYNFAANKCDNVIVEQVSLVNLSLSVHARFCFYWNTCHAKRGKFMRWSIINAVLVSKYLLVYLAPRFLAVASRRLAVQTGCNCDKISTIFYFK